MKPIEQLYYLLKNYYINNYTTESFVDEFYRIYNFEVDDSALSPIEKNLFSELSNIIARFSPFEEDLKIANAYFSEDDVRKKAFDVYLRLKQIR